MTTVAFLIVAFLAVVLFIALYNKFIKLRNMVQEGWSLIDIQLKKRYDIIPQLVTVVKAFASHEKDLLHDITAMRAKAIDCTARKDKEIAENVLSDKIASLMVTMEAYPELKSNENFLQLQNQLFHIEENLQMARRYYNGTVRNYNIATQSFPGNFVATFFNFEKYDFFSLDSVEERKSYTLSFKEE
jgi:LemA protein